jgi:hypothetical protein
MSNPHPYLNVNDRRHRQAVVRDTEALAPLLTADLGRHPLNDQQRAAITLRIENPQSSLVTLANQLGISRNAYAALLWRMRRRAATWSARQRSTAS